MGDTALWIWAFIPAGCLCILGSMIAMTLKPVERAERTETQAEPAPATMKAA